MSSDTHHNSDKTERQESQHYTSASVDLNGKINLSNRCTDINVYSSNYSKRKASATKGHKGLTDKDKEKIEQALYKLGITYGFHNLKWLVLTFDTNTSNEALVNILKNYNKLRDAIRTKLNNIYKHFDVNPYFVVYGIRKHTSFDRKIVCFDVNIICVAQDKSGKELLNVDNFIYQLELSLLEHIAKEVIKI